MSLLVRTLLGGAAAGAVMYLAWRWVGPSGLVLASPAVGLALARPLVESSGLAARGLGRLAWRKVAGRYVEYRGKSLDVHIDERATCWIATADLRKIVALPADAVLQRRFPAGCRETGEPVSWRLDAQALLEFLATASDPEGVRLCHWLRREVMRPAFNKRAMRLGLKRDV